MALSINDIVVDADLNVAGGTHGYGFPFAWAYDNSSAIASHIDSFNNDQTFLFELNTGSTLNQQNVGPAVAGPVDGVLFAPQQNTGQANNNVTLENIGNVVNV